MAVWSIIRFKVLPNYKIQVAFADGRRHVSAYSNVGNIDSRGEEQKGCVTNASCRMEVPGLPGAGHEPSRLDASRL